LRKAIGYFDPGNPLGKSIKEDLSDTEKVRMIREFLRFSGERLGIKFFWKERIFPAFRGLVKNIDVKNVSSDDRAFINGIEKIGSGNPENAFRFLKRMEELDREKNIAEDFRDSVIAMAAAAKKEDRVILLGLDESWINNKRGVQTVIAEIERLPEKLRQKGLDNVIFKRGEGKEVAEEISKEMEERKQRLPLSNIIVLGGKSILDSPAFRKLRNSRLQESALLIGVDDKNLDVTSGIRILEVFLLALRLKSVTLPEASGPEYNEKVLQIYEKLFKSLDTKYVEIGLRFNNGFWDFIFTPITPYNISEAAERNRIQVKAFDIKA
jgi:hypothetical protein